MCFVFSSFFFFVIFGYHYLGGLINKKMFCTSHSFYHMVPSQFVASKVLFNFRFLFLSKLAMLAHIELVKVDITD